MIVSKGKDLALGNGNQKAYWHWLEELSLVTPFSFCLGLDYCHREIPTTLLLDWHSTIHILQATWQTTTLQQLTQDENCYKVICRSQCS